MQALRNFFKTTLIGGLIVLLPIAVIALVFTWLWLKLTSAIEPLTGVLVAQAGLGQLLAEIAALGIILGLCFLVGLVVRTAVGRFIHESLEKRVLRFAPGYSLIRETALQFLGRKRSPFSRVALVRLFGGQTLMTAFITDEHPSGLVTVFVPTGPNPTSGLIYHVEVQNVFPVAIGVEEAMRSIISCGSGSEKILDAYRQNAHARPNEA